MSLEETKEKQTDVSVRLNEKIICDWKSKWNYIYTWRKINNISECNLLHDIINPPKRAKKLNSHYSIIMHGCINIRKGRAKFKKFLILLDSGCSSTIAMRRLVEKLSLEKDALMQWHTQAGNITTNLKVKLDFTLPALIATNALTWKCHVDESAKGIYDMI